ncbi:Cationic amino acid transporter 2, vacuolar [Hibiscus syriacus]|uniref:Cationic amino acid transporter 2, vacuolar n=1 Tax=Hibiscus syriacus TaxID=106335 RepID=A0A6A3BX83_HIBSY|nr:Cationic amino acid transporter 2, vacuolar [Hibiscus syriacus]
MGVSVGSQIECFGSPWGGLRNLMRRKQVDSAHSKPLDRHNLAKALTVSHLIAVGVGSTIGAGVYILVGTVAREHTGPALTFSFLIAGIAAALSAFCYAELASRCPSAGSAYHYSYICVGEGVAWLVGWALILEYTIAGGYLGFKTGWTGYELPNGYFPFGVDGMLAGSATVFFAYIGFDTVASTAEEAKNPKRDLPLGIALSLAICCGLYMLVSVVIVGLVPYYAMDPDTPISSAFADNGMQWAAYIITVGAVTSLISTLMGSILPQPRILMAMARDGLLPPFFLMLTKKPKFLSIARWQLV